MREMQDKYESAKIGRTNRADFVIDMELLRIELDSEFGIKKSEDEFLNRLMRSVDMKEYEMDKKLLKKDQDNKTLTINTFVSGLRSTFKERFDKDSENKNNSSEVSMSYKGFKGNCNYCGKVGHKKARVQKVSCRQEKERTQQFQC